MPQSRCDPSAWAIEARTSHTQGPTSGLCVIRPEQSMARRSRAAPQHPECEAKVVKHTRTKTCTVALGLNWRGPGSRKPIPVQEHLPMRPRAATYLFCVLAAHGLSTAARADAAFTCFPANHATHVNPDTHLVLTFSSPPTVGKAGQIRIYDADGHHLVDSLDLSIPAGPDPA